jgi:hypothetical protein
MVVESDLKEEFSNMFSLLTVPERNFTNLKPFLQTFPTFQEHISPCLRATPFIENDFEETLG